MNFFAELSPQAKAVIGGLLLVVLLAVGANFIPRGGGQSAGGEGGGSAASGEVVIFSNMEPKVAAEAAAVLKEKQIPFRLVKEGTAISVPADKADDARIKLAVAGQPKEGDVGFSQLFGDKPNSFISTDFEKKTAYNRAVMGELARVIKRIDGVENASVLINIPEEQLFAEEKKPTTASVMVKLGQGRAIGKEQVEGIVHLVASSVPGLRTNNVTVVNHLGKLLTEGMSDNAGDVEDRLATKALKQQMEMTREREAAVESKLQSLLDKVYGSGRAVARVAMELDFTQEKRRQRLYAPPNDLKGGNAPTYSERTTEKSSNGSSNGGVPGTTSNIPTYPMDTNSGANGSSSERTTERVQNSSYSMSESLTEGEVGQIKRMAVTVLVQGLAADRINDLTQIVTNASGADVARRGDSVVVRSVNFDDSQLRALKDLMDAEEKAKEAANPKSKKKEGGIPLSWIIGTGAAFVILFLLIAIMRMANRKEDTTDVLVNTLGDPGLPPSFDPNALSGYNGMEMTGSVPQMGGVGDGPFSFLEQMDVETVAELISQERPGTAAGILGLIDPGYADAVLNMLPPDMADDLVNRIQTSPELPAIQQRTIAQQLKRRLGVPA